MARIAVLGAGSWGTALAVHLARLDHEVRLWSRDPDRGRDLEAKRENRIYLPGFGFPPRIRVMWELERATGGAEAIVLAVPSLALGATVEKALGGGTEGGTWVIATKGLEESTNRRMSEVFAAVHDRPPVVLAGPSLAVEVAAARPTTVLAASVDAHRAAAVQQLVHGPAFRVYTSTDVVGVELGTSLKNVVALAAGIVDGMELGANARGALLTRGLAEITRLGVALGARRETFQGLAGVGDLVTTCSSPLSRNRSLGEAIGRGLGVRQAIAGLRQVAEGVPTTRSAVRLAARAGVEMPIAEQVRRLLDEEIEPLEAVRALMSRPPRGEGEE
jgi:glycerol-3-phosphate dehydrogenase (NAD(P)+)